MQYQGNKKVPIIIGVIVVILFGFGLYFQLRDKNSSTKNTSTENVDPLSGETVYSPAGKTDEYYESDPNQPVYLGFSKLIDTGATQTQVESIKNALADFSVANKIGVTEVSINVNEIVPIMSDTEQGVDFPIRVNRSIDFSVSVKYISLDAVSLVVKSKNDQVFSTVVDPANETDNDLVD